LADTEEVVTLAGLSIKTLLLATIGILLFGIYVGILIYGENSLTVLQHLKEKKRALKQEAQILKAENQRLQKEYFELKQLEPKE
jgi:cell division protein FtsB